MLRRPLRYAYEKLGPRYPRWAIWVQFQFALRGRARRRRRCCTLYVDLDERGVLADPDRRRRCWS